MDRMLVVVFDNEEKAEEGKRALWKLDSDGNIGLFSCAVVTKKADGTAIVKEEGDPGPLGSVFGTAVGSLIGLVFGPAGLVIGAAAGLAGGATADLTHAGVGEDFIDDVSRALLPTKTAVIAEIDENWTFPVDNRMDALGGIVLRRSRSDVRHQIHEEDVASMKADLAQMKAEHAQAHADHKAKLQEKINQLDTKIQLQLEKAKERRKASELEAQVKARVLKAKAAVAEAVTS